MRDRCVSKPGAQDEGLQAEASESHRWLSSVYAELPGGGAHALSTGCECDPKLGPICLNPLLTPEASHSTLPGAHTVCLLRSGNYSPHPAEPKPRPLHPGFPPLVCGCFPGWPLSQANSGLLLSLLWAPPPTPHLRSPPSQAVCMQRGSAWHHDGLTMTLRWGESCSPTATEFQRVLSSELGTCLPGPDLL